jgi:hypothetical protein
MIKWVEDREARCLVDSRTEAAQERKTIWLSYGLHLHGCHHVNTEWPC